MDQWPTPFKPSKEYLDRDKKINEEIEALKLKRFEMRATDILRHYRLLCGYEEANFALHTIVSKLKDTSARIRRVGVADSANFEIDTDEDGEVTWESEHHCIWMPIAGIVSAVSNAEVATIPKGKVAYVVTSITDEHDCTYGTIYFIAVDPEIPELELQV